MMHLSRSHRSTYGFTLVELSIVLVIIGLIIGGVLTGQQIIQNARITNTVNAVQAYSAAFQSYAQNYGALPGDDPDDYVRFPNGGLAQATTKSTGAVGDSGIDACTTPGTKNLQAWADLRAAGFVKNQLSNMSSAVQPPNPFNSGVYCFQNGAFAGAFTTTVLCLNNVPGDAAQAIDSRLDDGLTNTGIIRASSVDATNAPDTQTSGSNYYDATGAFTLCLRI